MATSSPRRFLSALCVGLALGAAAAQEPAATTAPADPFDICALPVTRLVFTLADLKTRDCASDADCSSVCWCRAWATGPVTASTLALCVPANATAPCAGDARDCTAVLPTRNVSSEASLSNNTQSNTTTSSNSSNSHTLNTIQADKKIDNDASKGGDGGGMSTGVAVVVALVCAAVVVALAVAANWYRNRPRSTSAPATVMGGIQSGRSLALSELDDFDGDKQPGMTRATHRGSLASLGPMHIDQNASIISGVSGASYHDIDSAHLGHLNQAHALTDTELSLSKDANERVFSPLSAGRGSELASASFVSTDSSVAIAPLGHRGGLDHFQRPPQQRGYPYGGAESDTSSFVSDVSTAYLTNNESFSSQLTIPESDNGEPKEVEF